MKNRDENDGSEREEEEERKNEKGSYFAYFEAFPERVGHRWRKRWSGITMIGHVTEALYTVVFSGLTCFPLGVN